MCLPAHDQLARARSERATATPELATQRELQFKALFVKIQHARLDHSSAANTLDLEERQRRLRKEEKHQQESHSGGIEAENHKAKELKTQSKKQPKIGAKMVGKLAPTQKNLANRQKTG